MTKTVPFEVCDVGVYQRAIEIFLTKPTLSSILKNVNPLLDDAHPLFKYVWPHVTTPSGLAPYEGDVIMVIYGSNPVIYKRLPGSVVSASKAYETPYVLKPREGFSPSTELPEFGGMRLSDAIDKWYNGDLPAPDAEEIDWGAVVDTPF